MNVHVTGHRLGFASRAVLRRVQQIAPDAARIITRQVGPLPHTTITVTTKAGLIELAQRADYAMVPEVPAADRRRWRREYKANGQYAAGHTLLEPRGVLALIAPAAGLAEADVVTLHELVHAAQMNRPGTRARLTAYNRHFFGIEPMPKAEVDAINRLIEDHETEAHGLEAQLLAALNGGIR
ncbi:hypothetical protein OS965_32815 [Streptomyces sp. H27-G5]|uniref:hypothetical protein n=1 Tax=Streptomyces sp. H27-G5 TaxID=2996698 RepID=UPI002271A454|nr:hypothetical protein [Streptomyces sp. H27-G5]MCY0922872.1 hypothetical protein [Streptomyces sp. H27-G5]